MISMRSFPTLTPGQTGSICAGSAGGSLHEHVSHRHVDRPDTPLMAHALALLTDELNVAAARLPETAGRLA